MYVVFGKPLLICIWRDNVSKNPTLLEFPFKFPMKGMLISDHKYAPKFSPWLLVPLQLNNSYQNSILLDNNYQNLPCIEYRQDMYALIRIGTYIIQTIAS
jgi:hypothetical protein